MPSDIADSFTAKSKPTNSGYASHAKKLHEAGKIYALFGFLDGLSCSYGTCKWFFDVFFPSPNT
jgi:hypothetical protein